MTDLKPVTILFNAGQTDAVAAKVMPNGVFERVINGRYRRDGALEIRQGFTPLTMGALEAFDLYSYGDNLMALGSTTEDYPTDLFVYNNVVAAAPWKGLDEPALLGSLVRGTDAQLVGGAPYTGSNIFGVTVAATTSLVAISASAFGVSSSAAVRTLHIFNPDTNATVLLEEDELSAGGGASWAVTLVSDFGWVRQNPTTGVVTLAVADVTGPAAPALGGSTTLFSDSDPTVPIVVKTDATRIHVLYRVAASNNVTYRQFTHAGVQNGTGKVVFSASATTRFALDIDSTQVHTLVKVSTTSVSLLTFGIASPFTTAVGPTAITTAVTDSTIAPGVELTAVGTELWLFYTTNVASQLSLVRERRSKAAHASNAVHNVDNFILNGGAAIVGDELVANAGHFAWLNEDGALGQGATAPLRMLASGPTFNWQPFYFMPLYYEDRQILMLSTLRGGGNLGFNVAVSGDYAYIPSGFNVTSGSMQANLRRVRVNSTRRRPAVELGGLLYMAGSQVLVTDGKQLVESGMPPGHIEEPSQGTDGALTQGGLYKYRAHWEWYDWKGNKHLSPVSREVEVQLTSANDAVTFTSQVPPTLRAYPPGEAIGSAPLLKLFRTETNLNALPAVLVIAPSTTQLTAISGGAIDTLETLSAGNRLQLNVNGAGLTPIDFTVAATNLSVIGQEIIAAFPGLTFSVDSTGTVLTLTTVATGLSASIVVGGGLVRGLLGLAVGQTVTGTVDAEAGELFFLTATATAKPVVSTSYAEFTVITDRTADSDLIDNETLYTTGDRGAVSGVLDFAPPLPASFITATRDRVVCAGRSEIVQISQKAFPNEAVAFVDTNLVGPVGFAYQARVEGNITGLAAVDDAIVVGTRDELFIIGGEGPNYVGIGEFTSPARLPSETGIYDNRATILCSEGLWFQGDVDKLYLMPRGGGAPAFDGKPVQDRLGTGLSGAASTEGDMPTVVFAVENVARLVVRDLVTKQWFEDSIPEPAARSFIEHRGLFYFVDDDGDVWGQGGFADNGAAVVLTVTTGTLAPFGLAGWGRLAGIVVLAERISDGTLQLEISYDEGVTYTSLGTETITGVATGTPARAEFVPAIQRGDRYKLRFTMTPTDGGAGLALHGFTLYVRASDAGPPRFESARRFS